MNESIGIKGGSRDNKRRNIITKAKKEKKSREKKELKELEKEVKRQQKFLLLKTIPLAITLGSLQIILKNKKQNKKEIKNIKIKKDIETKEITIIEKNKEIPIKIKIDSPIKEKIPIKKKYSIKEIERSKDKVTLKNKEKQIIKEVEEKEVEEKLDFKNLSIENKEKLEKLKSRKIIDVYEKELKNIRYDLRELVFEYNNIEENSDNKKIEKIIDKLTTLISKIEELKSKIKIKDLDKYDDNYIYTLIEGYLLEFNSNKEVEEIEDSKLYLLISSKLSQLDKTKENFENEVNDKKKDLKYHEKDFEKLKDNYLTIKNYNTSLEEFSKNQEKLLEEMEKKVAKATTTIEKTEIKIKTLNSGLVNLFNIIPLLMFLPGKRSAKQLALLTSIYLELNRRAFKQEKTKKKYKVIEVKDYSSDIKGNINMIKQSKELLASNSREVDKLILTLKNEYHEYKDLIKEYDSLLIMLEKIKNGLKEKEYEMNKLQEKQERILEKNNAKVLTRGKYQL